MFNKRRCIAKVYRSHPEEKRDKYTKWAKHLNAMVRVEDSNLNKGSEMLSRKSGLSQNQPTAFASSAEETDTPPVRPQQQEAGTARAKSVSV